MQLFQNALIINTVYYYLHIQYVSSTCWYHLKMRMYDRIRHVYETSDPVVFYFFIITMPCVA
jgi:hypothetical protein